MIMKQECLHGWKAEEENTSEPVHQLGPLLGMGT